MRYGNSVPLGVVLLISCSLCAAAPQDEPKIGKQGKNDLVLVVKPTKLVYHGRETVELHFALRNTSSNSLIVAKTLRLTANIALEITDSHGGTAQWCGRIAEWYDSARSYVTLSPGELVQATLAVSCVNKEDVKHAWGYTFGGAGRYTIKASYRLPRPAEYYKRLFPNETVARGPILAEPVTIEVK